MAFVPIAIVGQGCVLPGAFSAADLWQTVRTGRDLLGEAPPDRWGIAAERILAKSPDATADRALNNRGGYVRGFEGIFDPGGFALPGDQILKLDPLFQWTLQAGRAALHDAGARVPRNRIGAILGNLSYPSSFLARFAESVWLKDQPWLAGDLDRLQGLGGTPIDPRNRFMSGLPAHILASALNLGAGAFAIDAACASSLYAIKLACDALAEGRADLMLAGAVNRADDLFIHVGFTALNALSPTGRSRPFHAEADGLVPAEGAAFVALRRLSDAVRDGDRILAVIRGVGLSNDGRARGLLVPSAQGQIRAMRAAYQAADLDPRQISLCECHATGTAVGDAVEIASMTEVFAGVDDLPIGSLKGNLGHLITVAGVAGVMKVIGAMHAQERPPTLHADRPHADLSGRNLRVLRTVEPWPGPSPRRAGISAFGFGGNNAHLILEQWLGADRTPARPVATAGAVCTSDDSDRSEIAIVAIGARVGAADNVARFADAVFGRKATGALREVTVPLAGLRFPPRDLEETLPQQLLVLAAAGEALSQIESLPGERTGVLVGMQCDPAVARHGARWRAAEWANHLNADAAWLAATRDAFVPLLGAAGVVGAMPNICANRINSQYDFQGPSWTVSSEELSGVRALRLASVALARGELDAAVIGAVDLCAEAVHQAAARALCPEERQAGGDAAVVLVLKRAVDARRNGDPIWAIVAAEDTGKDLEDNTGETVAGTSDLHLGLHEAADGLHDLMTHAHAASGLIYVAAAALCLSAGKAPGSGASDTGNSTGRLPGQIPIRARVSINALGDQQEALFLRADSDRSGGDPLQIRTARTGQDNTATALRFAAHRSIPTLPPPPPHHTQTSHAPAAPTEFQIMAPAPILPPTLPHHHTTDQKVESWHAVQTPPLAPALAFTPPITGPLGDHLRHRQQIADIHQGYLSQQTVLHQRFLAGRAHAMTTLITGAGFIPRTGVMPGTMPPRFPQAGAITAHTRTTKSLPDPNSPPLSRDGDAHTASAPASGQEMARRNPHGPTFSREQLEVHASGRISSLFGPLFAQQDQHALQVRMPEPPLLLADRVIGIDAIAGSMGLGTVWTETDVRPDSWYLHGDRMPPGIMIEAGQADLFLISYLGIDFTNQGRRAYRLLGCELTYHGSPPQVGDTLRYDIHIDGHARQGEVRLFFFHYDCVIDGKPALTVRKGQAGFFSKADLEASQGVLWRPEDQEIRAEARIDPPAVPCTHRRFDEERVRAFAAGDLHACFGPNFEIGQTHVRSPGIQAGDMLLIDRIDDFDPVGGPWRRGYLRAVTAISPDRWFFQGHFKNDPCMPGTLMFEGCLQAMAFYLAGLGYTLNRDGWRFEPVPDVPYQLQCRGQVLPHSKELICELFVEEVHDGPVPTLYADLLGTVDGLKAFHARRVGLQLVPDWPLTTQRARLDGYQENRRVAEADGFRFDFASLLACAWGKPSDAFGPMYRVFDGHRRVARLPGPPYHFMTRVSRTYGGIGEMKEGAEVEIEYDVPEDAWYFQENRAPTMPFCVLLEASLQPCGWLASFVGSALAVKEDLAFRNLDGNGKVLAEVLPTSGTLRTRVKLRSISHSAGMIIESFDVMVLAGDTPIYTLDTTFGFFPKAALENQVGLPVSAGQRQMLQAESTFLVNLRDRPDRYCAGTAGLPSAMLLMLDRITACEATGGHAGRGWLRGEKDVDPAEWFFKAHFFQDPVQPGSLGLAAMQQLLQFFMLHQGLHEGMARPRFLSIDVGRETVWKYRGQVVPGNQRITTTLEITDIGRDERGAFAVGDASLWVDGKRIYEARSLGMRLIDEGESLQAKAVQSTVTSHKATSDRFAVSTPPTVLAVDDVQDFWRRHFRLSDWPGEDLYRGLINRFVRRLVMHDPGGLDRALAGPVLFLGNHQVAIESTLFAIMVSALTRTPIITLAKIENRHHWLELIMQHTFSYPGLINPAMAAHFDRSRPESLPGIIDKLAATMIGEKRSVMVHVEGTRSLDCRTPVNRMSGTFIDMALRVGCPIVPVRFWGGLPATPLAQRAEFPVAFGQQDYHLGRPLWPDDLRGLDYRQRIDTVVAAINQTGPPNAEEDVLPGDPGFRDRVQKYAVRIGSDDHHAALVCTLDELDAPCVDTRRVLAALKDGSAITGTTPQDVWLARFIKMLKGQTAT